MAQPEPYRSPHHLRELRNDRDESSSDTDSFDYLDITVVVAKNGEHMLMKRDGEELQAAHEIPLMESPYERSKLLRQQICAFFGILANTYVIVSTSIGDEASGYCCLIDILEVIGDACTVRESFEWVEWKKMASKFKDVCPDPEVARFLQSYLSNMEVPELNLSLTPWRRVGFFSSFFPKLLDLIGETGLELTGRPEQVHFGSCSTVFEVPTNQETLFVKIGFTGNDEPRITRAISELFPNETPKLLATDDKLEVMICTDHGQSVNNKYVVITQDKPQMESCEIKRVFECVMTEWARLQKESIGMQADLISKGVPVYGPLQIREAYTELVCYMKETKLDTEFDKVFQMDTHLDKTFDAWDRFNLPNTLVHGDLHNSNVAQPGGVGSKFIFFDWDCAFIGHPFLDLHYDKNENMSLGEDKYLECWEEYGCHQSLRQLVLMTRPVRCVIEAHRTYRKGIWTEEERKESVWRYLEKVVECLEGVKCEEIGETISV